MSIAQGVGARAIRDIRDGASPSGFAAAPTSAVELAAALESTIADVPSDELPALLAVLAGCLARTSARLLRPDSLRAPVTSSGNDENLCVEEASRRLGVSPDWLYRHHRRLPFTRRIGRRLLFSARGLERWNAQQR